MIDPHLTSQQFSPCVLIPVYNHARTVPALLDALAEFQLPCILINDGSDAEATEQLRKLSIERPELVLEEQFPNQGKGAAVMLGLKRAHAEGYSHAAQIDADGQHCTADLAKLLAAAKNAPQALVTGTPIYDQSVPKGRLIGRYITHFWVWVETLSFSIRDSMCGFRVYPLAEAVALIDATPLGQRMDFDTEIMVRLYWRGVRVISIPTRVTYPEDGTSNFRLWRDNLYITRMHTRLFFSMLPRIPRLLWRNLTRYNRAVHDAG